MSKNSTAGKTPEIIYRNGKPSKVIIGIKEYEALLEAGANFASSPKRVLIHAYDPVFVMEKVAYTSIYDPIVLKDIISSTITGFDGIGGVERNGA